MNELVLLEDVLTTSVLSGKEEGILFAKAGWLVMAGGTYDFIFHYVGGLGPGRIRSARFLAIPLLGYTIPEERDQATIRMYEIHRSNPLLVTFAVRDRHEKIATSPDGATESVSFSLRFFDVLKADLGTEVVRRDTHYIASTEDICRHFTTLFPDIQNLWASWRAEIDGAVCGLDSSTPVNPAVADNLPMKPKPARKPSTKKRP